MSSLSITEITSNSVRFSWTLYSDSKADKIMITLTQNTQSQTEETFTVAGNVNSHVVRDLPPITPYRVQVKVVLGDKHSSAKTHGFMTDATLGEFITLKKSRFQTKHTYNLETPERFNPLVVRAFFFKYRKFHF